MKKYEWSIYGVSGKLKAENLKEATVGAINKYFGNIPCPEKTSTRLDIYVKEIKKS